MDRAYRGGVKPPRSVSSYEAKEGATRADIPRGQCMDDPDQG